MGLQNPIMGDYTHHAIENQARPKLSFRGIDAAASPLREFGGRDRQILRVDGLGPISFRVERGAIPFAQEPQNLFRGGARAASLHFLPSKEGNRQNGGK